MRRLSPPAVLSSLAAIVSFFSAPDLSAQRTRRVADLGSCPTGAGELVADCTVVYRTFGRLNERRDNAVLVPTWHGGRSETMLFLLGADGWIDTTRYFAVLVDAPGNGTSISPSTSRRQPGARFPRLSLEDMVAAEHRLVTERLGIRRLHAVVGWSMGGMQAIAWAQRHPEAVDRIVSVAGTPRMGSYDLYWVRSMVTLLDLGRRAGLPRDTLAYKLAELWHTVATTPARENKLPRDSTHAMLAAEARADWLWFDPEDNRLHLEAIAAFDAIAEARRGSPPGARGKARGPETPRMLVIFMPEDHVTTAESFREFAGLTGADTVSLASPCGHLAPLCEGEAIGALVRGYLEEGVTTTLR